MTPGENVVLQGIYITLILMMVSAVLYWYGWRR